MDEVHLTGHNLLLVRLQTQQLEAGSISRSANPASFPILQISSSPAPTQDPISLYVLLDFEAAKREDC